MEEFIVSYNLIVINFVPSLKTDYPFLDFSFYSTNLVKKIIYTVIIG